jgi:hypothetical protein
MQFYRATGENMAKANELFNTEQKPILDVLVPLGVEKWRQEGLFRRDTDCSIGRKICFVQSLYARYNELPPQDQCDVRAEKNRCGITREQILCEHRFMVRRKFAVITDTDMREIMMNMICTEKLRPVRALARQLKYNWVQFVFDFNDGLRELMGIKR